MSVRLTETEVDRLGERLKAGDVSEADLRLLDHSVDPIEPRQREYSAQPDAGHRGLPIGCAGRGSAGRSRAVAATPIS